ncbi:hypothetical protein FA10DRAFT_283479 [Acaromyces ingoldii]|uniref:Tetraspanin Tsp2 n=1 Tax=Acaromyces ingoldii TaxID=215250 RepID=A0A316YXS6_9BASI|nr:hypothetical protein FA10DRAFT_283479 [Acaromyces ingoldii]PWN93856.1 hypothetical protein FA10DRAFT_283479 [Acaromyces ingoldii]
MACSLLVWARGWRGAEVSMIVDVDLLILLSLACFICLLTSIVGLSGSLLNSRPILALYTFLLWPCLVSKLVVGYISYKRANFRLDRKLNMVWSRYLTNLDRLRIQENLQCCGYYSPLHQATFSRMCYPRTNLPGCKGPLFAAESLSLRRLYRATFSLVFVHLVNILVSLLCSNHVNVNFGKGLTPRRYRLNGTHVEINAAGAMRELDDLDEYRRRSMKRQLGLGLANMDRDEALRHHQERESLHYSSS